MKVVGTSEISKESNAIPKYSDNIRLQGNSRNTMGLLWSVFKNLKDFDIFISEPSHFIETDLNFVSVNGFIPTVAERAQCTASEENTCK